MVRRIVGLALTAAMFHLNVERVNLFCAKHTAISPEHAGHTGNAPHQAADQHSADHHPADHHQTATDAGRDVPQDADSHQSAGRPDCCDQLAACASMLGLRADRPMIHAMRLQIESMAVAHRDGAKWDTAPPVPPPKA